MSDGINPYGSLIEVSSVLYGTTSLGGTNNTGTIFSINPDGSGYTVLYSFGTGTDGQNPQASLLVIGSVLYGTCFNGGTNGTGTVFSINSDGSGYNDIYSFAGGTDGTNPFAPLISDGSVLYGTTYNGGTNSDGTIFSINPDGSSYSTLHNFAGGSDGEYSNALLLVGSVLYGTCQDGGTNGNGTIYKINPDGSGYSTVYNFGTGIDGNNPQAPLIEVSSVLYGTTNDGGTDGFGTIFKINPDGSGYATLYNFEGSPDGGTTYTPLFAIGSVLYGTSSNGGSNVTGTIFKINTDGSSYDTLYNFVGGTDGATPFSGLMEAGSVLYGTCNLGGTNSDGTIFSINPDGSSYSTLHNFGVSSGTVNPSELTLSTILYTPTITPGLVQIVHPSVLTLNTTLYTPSTPGLGVLVQNILKIISYNPLIAICDTTPVTVAIINTTGPTWSLYTYSGVENPTDVQIDEQGNVSIACADGNLLQFNISTPNTYSVINTGASGNLNSLALLLTSEGSTSDVFAGTDYSTGEVVDMYEGNTIEISCDVRFSQLVQPIFGMNICTLNNSYVNTDFRWSSYTNTSLGCDIRFLAEPISYLSMIPIQRTDFVVYIGGVEVTDVQLESIEITHTADEKSQATFILARQHDNVDYMLDGSYSPVTGNPIVQITIKGNEEFGYNTPAYVWDIDTKSENEQVKITAFSELPQQDIRNIITLSIPGINDKLHVYHALIDNPTIDDAYILPDDINPPFYLGILIDNGEERIQNVIQLQGLSSIAFAGINYPNYILGSGDSGVYDVNGNNIYYKPVQNWTYFWFAHATDFITGQTWVGLLNNASSYLGTSPSSLTSKTWDVDYINFWYQRQFPDSVYRGTKEGGGSAVVYPSDFIGLVDIPYKPDPYDTVVGIDPYNGATTIDEVLRDHTPRTFTGNDILTAKQKLALFTNPGSFAIVVNTAVAPITYMATIEGDLIPMPLNLSTKILDVIDSKFGVTFGIAPFKKVSCKSGILTTFNKWEDAPNGLFYHQEQGYNYTNYVNEVGPLEFKKIQNINGSVLPKTKCDVQVFIDGYYYYGLAVLSRINIDNTIMSNIYNGNNGFPVSIKSITISAKDMKVRLNCTNAWSRLELLEIEGEMPDPYYSLIPERIIEYSPKFDPNTLQNLS